MAPDEKGRDNSIYFYFLVNWHCVAAPVSHVRLDAIETEIVTAFNLATMVAISYIQLPM